MNDILKLSDLLAQADQLSAALAKNAEITKRSPHLVSCRVRISAANDSIALVKADLDANPLPSADAAAPAPDKKAPKTPAS